MAENGEEKLIAVARHIAKTLGHTDTMTTDILNIFSNFDGRLREKLSKDTAEQTIISLHRKLSRHFSSDEPIWSNSAEFYSFLHSVDRLIAVVREWTPLAATTAADDDDKTIASCVDRAEGLLQQSMSRLKDEFRTLLITRSSPSSSDFSIEDDNRIPAAETIGNLHEIAKRMATAGHIQECSHVYVTCRQEFLEDTLSKLGLLKLNTHEVHKMQWSQLEEEIDKWINAIKMMLRTLFPTEQRLRDRIFSGLSSTAELSFMEICNTSAIHFLNFPNAVATGSRSPEMLFKVLDVYETVRDLIPEFELLFSDNHSMLLRDEAISIRQRLGELIKDIFIELENLIRRDPAKAVVPGGGLHPINRYAMNYLCTACRSYQTLEQVFDESVDDRALAVRVAWLMELLESNLEAKSKFYRDPALCAVFMMNNMRYIVQKVKGSEMGSILGADWIRKNMAKIRQYHVNYQRSSWAKVLGVLKVDNSSLSPMKSLREKLKVFNSSFEEMCRVQSSWVICDDQLREELMISVSGTVSQAYRSFIGRLQANLDVGKHGDRYVRLSVEDIEARIAELFQGRR